jgi:hypothetical protein
MSEEKMHMKHFIKEYPFPIAILVAALFGLAFPGLLYETDRLYGAGKAASFLVLFVMSVVCIVIGCMSIFKGDVETMLGAFAMMIGGLILYWLFSGALKVPFVTQ